MWAITEDYVSFEIAKLLKEKGFYSEDCFAFYKKNGEIGFLQTFGDIVDYDSETCVIAPTHQMAMKWLREVHNIGIFPTTFYRHTATFDGHNYGCTLVNLKTFDVIGDIEDCTFPADSYEETCEAAIKYCLENLI